VKTETPKKLTQAEEERIEIVGRIYDEIGRLAGTLRELYSPVERFIAENEVARERFEMRFEVAVTCEAIEDVLLSLINQRARGSFSGAVEGRQRITDMVSGTDFNSKDAVLAFVRTLLQDVKTDARTSPREPRDVRSQLVKGYLPKDVYDVVTHLGYLKPVYALSLGEKRLEQLSPGEKGALLLLFYLLVDKDDVPLVVDQPEENLDNETVYKLLVPCIRRARERRQVIMVTHNPNLAVVCDSEQIIHADMDKTHGNRVTYVAGAIECPEMNKHLLDVLDRKSVV
jgi:hypothetical protein